MTYLYGHQSEEIRQLQIKLGIEADGGFGPNTLAAVKKFQEENKLSPADGVVRQDMLDILFPKPVKVSILSWLPVLINLSQGKISMNKDQFINLIQTIVNVGSGLAVSYGILDANTWVAVGAGIVALGTYVYTHFWNKTA